MELLVVIAILMLAVTIVLPVVGRVRTVARVSNCLSRQRQLAVGVNTFAGEHADQIPRGPDSLSFIPGQFQSAAEVWEFEVASSIVQLPGAVLNAHGILLNGYITDSRAIFCPGDDTADPEQELVKIGNPAQLVFSSYLYRQLDQAPRGLLSDMGDNDEGVLATVLVLDSNSVYDASADTYRTNHQSNPVNAAFTDGHARSFVNEQNTFSLAASDYAGGWPGIESAYNRMLIIADREP